MANRKYDPIRETFVSEPIFSNAQLTLATTPAGGPPNDLILDNTNLLNGPVYADPALPPQSAPFNRTGVTAYPYTNTEAEQGEFDKSDIPRLVGAGIFSNLGDCLVDISSMVPGGQLGFSLNLMVYDDDTEATFYSATDYYYNTLGVSPPIIPVRTLNVLMDYDLSFYNEVSIGIPAMLAANPTFVPQHFKILVRPDTGSTASYSTILVDPAFKTKQVTFWTNLIFEHTFPMRLVANS